MTTPDITITVNASTARVTVQAHTDAGATWLRRRALALPLTVNKVDEVANDAQLSGLTVSVDRFGENG